MSQPWVSTEAGRHLAGRGKVNTAPEVLLRKALHAEGARFRLHPQLAKGCTPDVVLSRRRLAVFVDGCYWHSCPEHGRQAPWTGPNAALWAAKMAKNVERDTRSTAIAQELGWTVIRVWEHDITTDAASVAARVLAGESGRPGSDA